MILTTTIRIDDKVKEAGQQKAKDNSIKGGFSGYIESLIVQDLKKDGLKIKGK